MSGRATLRRVSTAVLEQLRAAIAADQLRPPLDRAGLVGFGIRHQLEAIEHALAGHRSAACLAILDVTLAEREQKRPAPELVWTGPEAPAGTARDTSIVLRELFEGARESVVLGGYSFKYGGDLFAPLHQSMRAHDVDARFFVHIPQVTASEAHDAEGHLRAHLSGFMEESWPYGQPWPRIYYDKRALVVGPPYSSLHAKCVSVDGARAFVSSANFTQRAQERNIEVGVLIDDPSFASFLAAQWMGLIDAGLVGEFVPPF